MSVELGRAAKHEVVLQSGHETMSRHLRIIRGALTADPRVEHPAVKLLGQLTIFVMKRTYEGICEFLVQLFFPMNQLAHDVCKAILVQLLDIVGFHVVDVLDLGVAAAFRFGPTDGQPQVGILLKEAKLLCFLVGGGMSISASSPASSLCIRAEESLVIHLAHGSHCLQLGGKLLVESVGPGPETYFFKKSIFELLEAYHTMI